MDLQNVKYWREYINKNWSEMCEMKESVCTIKLMNDSLDLKLSNFPNNVPVRFALLIFYMYVAVFRSNYRIDSLSCWQALRRVIFIYHPDAISSRRTSSYGIDTGAICILMDDSLQKFKERLLHATWSYFDFGRIALFLNIVQGCKIQKRHR